jgi:hypothetical protein
MRAHSYNDRESRWARRFREGKAQPASFLTVVNVEVPANIERVEDHTPCFYCGTRAGLPCRHRSIAA